MNGCKPALIVVPGGTNAYTDPENVPPADRVREVVVDAIEDAWGRSGDIIHDVREGEVLIQHEVPPTDPYDAYGVVVTFGQLPITDYNRHRDGPWRFSNLESPLFPAIEALHRELEETIEVWLDGSDAGAGEGP